MRASEPLLVAVASGLATATLAYAGLRAVDALFFPAPNPVAIIWTEKSGFLWRAAGALYLGGLAALGAYALARRAPDSAANWLFRLTITAAATLALTALFLP